ncbi:MAG: dipeptidase [Chloroflexi bacterium]|nr:dipeptidase [Chloroflexota bacterium]
MAMNKQALEYVDSHADKFKNQLKELLSIPSVSTLVEHQADCERAAEWLAADMRRIGFDTVEVIHTKWHPVVFAEWMGAGADAPTVLVYCHYDVQPAEMSDGWHTPPFEPTERDGKVFARGAIDSKSNVMAQLKAAEAVIKTGTAPVNIKLMFEGDEESASENMTTFVAQYADRLKCDVAIICDGSMADREQPDIAYGLRGVVTMELEVHGPKQDLHSGHFGGTVHNPIQALAEIISQLHNADGSVNVAGFYDDVLPLDDEERAELAKPLPWIQTEWADVAAAPGVWGEPNYNLHERIGARPTLEINGIRGGFAGDGFKTVLPGMALAKISCRLVPNQTSQVIYERLRDAIAAITPRTVTAELRLIEIGEPALIDRHSPAVEAARSAYTQVWGKEPHFVREGGSIPVVVDLQKALDAQLVLMSFGYKGCAAHGPNEHVYLDMWYKGMAITIQFYEELSKGMKQA